MGVGRVLSEKEKHLYNMDRAELIATIRDEQRKNKILLEALERIDYLSKYYSAKLSCHMDKETMEQLKLEPIAQEFTDIVREALMTIGG